MPNYKQLYFTLFNAITTAIERIDDANYDDARALLVHAQQLTEEMYIESGEENVSDT